MFSKFQERVDERWVKTDLFRTHYSKLLRIYQYQNHFYKKQIYIYFCSFLLSETNPVIFSKYLFFNLPLPSRRGSDI